MSFNKMNQVLEAPKTESNLSNIVTDIQHMKSNGNVNIQRKYKLKPPQNDEMNRMEVQDSDPNTLHNVEAPDAVDAAAKASTMNSNGGMDSSNMPIVLSKVNSKQTLEATKHAEVAAEPQNNTNSLDTKDGGNRCGTIKICNVNPSQNVKPNSSVSEINGGNKSGKITIENKNMNDIQNGTQAIRCQQGVGVGQHPVRVLPTVKSNGKRSCGVAIKPNTKKVPVLKTAQTTHSNDVKTKGTVEIIEGGNPGDKSPGLGNVCKIRKISKAGSPNLSPVEKNKKVGTVVSDSISETNSTNDQIKQTSLDSSNKSGSVLLPGYRKISRNNHPTDQVCTTYLDAFKNFIYERDRMMDTQPAANKLKIGADADEASKCREAKWTEEDKHNFRLALRLYGKNFKNIQKMLPNKTTGELVSYFYKEKNKKCVPKPSAAVRSKDPLPSVSNNQIKIHGEVDAKVPPNCPTAIAKECPVKTPLQKYFKTFGNKKIPIQKKSKPLLKAVLCKNQKKLGESMKAPTIRIQSEVTTPWTENERLLAVNYVKMYGKDFSKISKQLGNKSIMQVSEFFEQYNEIYGLEKIATECKENILMSKIRSKINEQLNK